MKWLGLLLLSVFALIGAITVVDLLTVKIGTRSLIGGTPYYSDDENPTLLLGGRIVRFPPMLQQDGRRAAVLDADYFFCSPATGKIIRLPEGYQTDFASIPTVARVLIDRFGNSLEPAGIHDWLYSVGTGAGSPEGERLREEADGIFLRGLEDNNVGLATRTIMYWSVRLFGGGAYGTPGEWDKRIRMKSGEPFSPPIDKPTVGWVEQSSCDNFDERVNHLVGCYSSSAALRFPGSVAPAGAMGTEEECGPGDGLTVPRS